MLSFYRPRPPICSEELIQMAKQKDPKKTRGTKKVRKATKKQRRNKISKSGKPKGEENKLNANPA
jgi:hypothetical protein